MEGFDKAGVSDDIAVSDDGDDLLNAKRVADRNESELGLQLGQAMGGDDDQAVAVSGDAFPAGGVVVGTAIGTVGEAMRLKSTGEERSDADGQGRRGVLGEIIRSDCAAALEGMGAVTDQDVLPAEEWKGEQGLAEG